MLENINNNAEAMQMFQSIVQHQLNRIDASTANADGEVVDALEHFFWGMKSGLAMELGALDGTPDTHSMTHEYEKSLGWRRYRQSPFVIRLVVEINSPLLQLLET